MDAYELAVKLWRQKNIQNDAQLSAALNGHRISFAYNSGKIENSKITYNDTREIFENDGVTSYTGDIRTLFEIRNAKEANELFLNAFNAKLPLSEELIKKFQKLLTQNTYDTRRYQLGERPGEYKKHDYVTGKEEVGAAPDDVQAEMNELIEELQDITEDIALKASAYFHVKFENIHPFADGNGRTGRLVMNYILVSHNHPPVTIHEEDKKDYYSSLESWDKFQTLDPMVKFIKEQTIKTWQKIIEKSFNIAE